MSNYRMKIPVLKDGVAKKSMLLLFQQLRQQILSKSLQQGIE